MPSWAAVSNCRVSPAVLPGMLGSVCCWDTLASLLSCVPLFCAATRGQMQLCLLGASQAQHVSSTVIYFPSQKAIIWATLVIWLLMGTAGSHTHTGTEYRAWLWHRLCWRKLHPCFTSWPHISSWGKRKRPHIAPRWFRSDIRKNPFTGRVVRHWNPEEWWIHPSWSVQNPSRVMLRDMV